MRQPKQEGSNRIAENVLESLREGCQVIGSDYRYLYVNEAVTRHGRTTRDALLGRTMMEVYPGIENTEMFAVLRQCMEDRTPREMENEFTFPDGSRGWFDLRFEPVPEGVAILSMDITERKRAEAALRRTTRALTALSRCNQAMVRASDEQRFMEEVCRIVVEQAGYLMAWIGMKESGEEGAVRPVASAGFDAGYTGAARVVWTDTERGAGPTGRAIRTGETVVARRIATDPTFAPWREEALSRGFASSIALPIRDNGNVLGALNIYAAEPDAFDDAERKLLEEMALDLGYGITALRTRVARDRAEEALAREQERYREFVLHLEDVVFSLDSEGRIEFMSPALERNYGFTPEAVRGKYFRDFVHPDDRPAIAASFERTLSGSVEPTDFRLFDAQGRLHYVRSKSCVRTERGRPVGVDGVLVDITELKQSQESLRAAVERWRGTFDAITDIVCVIAPNHTIAEINRAGCEALGLPREEIIGRRCYELVHRTLAPIAACPCVKASRTLEPAVSEYEQDGHTYELTAWPLLERDGRFAAFVHVVKDITARVTAEKGLKESEQRYRSLFENTSVGIAHCRIIFDGECPQDFVYLDVNPAFESLTGLRDVVGKRVTEVIPGIRESDAKLFEIFGRVARTGKPERFEFYLEALKQWFDLSVYSPQPDHFVAVFDVITKRKQAEEGLVAFSQRLERLTAVVQKLSQVRSIEEIVEIVRHAGRKLVGSDGSTFVLRDGDMCHYVDEDAIGPLWKGKKFPMSACISGWAMLNKQPAVIEDIYSDARIPHEAYRPTFVKSLVMVPIRGRDPIGAIGSYWASQHRATTEEVRILQALADSTSVAMENVRFLRELEEEKARTRALYDHLPNATFVWKREADGFVLSDFNEAARKATGGGVAAFLGKSPRDLTHAFPHTEEDLQNCFETHVPVRREVECIMPGATKPRRLVFTYGFIPSDMVILHTEDVTEQRQTEEQLRLSQRLDAVGRLAGGVAHDFNNLLSVIISYAGFLIDELKEADPLRDDAIEIQKAGQRAAALTRQLLAFSRKQILEPVPLDVNKVITDFEKMLRRLLGEDIDIEVHLAEDLGTVFADPGQLEQVIMNLAVNARDAMPSGGKLTIETANVELDASYAAGHVAVKPGRYVMLSVADTGTGMDAETQSHIFEPFFTTKEKGKGTGLGLSTVYGIVKQSGGYISVYSEPGRGTTFKVYLPRVDVAVMSVMPKPVPSKVSGRETVLVVEDEEAVRKLAERILRSAGYNVLVAASGGDALLLCEEHGGAIDLLLTDVVMPQVSGRELAERLTGMCPKLKVLYMSGYTDNAIVHHGVLDAGMRFIGKPFAAAELTRKVREVLDEGETVG